MVIPVDKKLGTEFIQANLDGILKYGEDWHETTRKIALIYYERGLDIFEHRTTILSQVAGLMEIKHDTMQPQSC